MTDGAEADGVTLGCAEEALAELPVRSLEVGGWSPAPMTGMRALGKEGASRRTRFLIMRLSWTWSLCGGLRFTACEAETRAKARAR